MVERVDAAVIGDPAPPFTAGTGQGKIDLPVGYADKQVIFFSPSRRLHSGVHQMITPRDDAAKAVARCSSSSPGV